MDQLNIEPQPAAPAPAFPPEALLSLSLRDGWEALKREPAILIGFVLLKIPVTAMVAIMLGGSSAIGSAFAPDSVRHLQSLLWGSIFALLDGIFSIGILYAALRVLRKEPVPFATFFAGFTRFVPVVIGLVLIELIVGFGIMFFVAPGIIFALAFSQWALLVMDRNVDAREALSRSWQMMRGYKADYFLLWLVLIAINILGLIPLGLGLIVTVPVTYATQAAFYDRLQRLQAQRASA
jgi:uncharacterized membrane protein